MPDGRSRAGIGFLPASDDPFLLFRPIADIAASLTPAAGR
jgi:hypothetical protein